MKILYIIGNGFDLNLDLETSYNQFYEFYKLVKSDNVNVQKLKENISKTYESWSNLELALGSYTQHLNEVKEFDDVMIDIGKELSKYLKIQEEKLENYEINQHMFFNYLISPENLFLSTDKEILIEYKNKWANYDRILNIYTFNYTSVIETICGDKQKNILLASKANNPITTLKEIKHIHGYLDTEMVIGVNDKSQIANESFRENRDILEFIVKSECNKANKNNIDREFTNEINTANLIYIFGSSIGDTDKKWWELIGERLKSTECRLIIFSRGDEIPARIRNMESRAERAVRDSFLSKTKLNENEMETMEDKIFIRINSGMFDGIMIKKAQVKTKSSNSYLVGER